MTLTESDFEDMYDIHEFYFVNGRILPLNFPK